LFGKSLWDNNFLCRINAVNSFFCKANKWVHKII
jgi:hypothetical protein